MGGIHGWNGAWITLAAALLGGCTPMTPAAATHSTSAPPPQASPATARAAGAAAGAAAATASPAPPSPSTSNEPRLPGQDACGLTAKVISAAVGRPMIQALAADRPGKVHCVYLEPQGFTSLGVDLPVGATHACDETRWTMYADEPVNEHQYGARQGGAFVVLDGKPTLTAANLRAILTALAHSRCT